MASLWHAPAAKTGLNRVFYVGAQVPRIRQESPNLPGFSAFIDFNAGESK